MTDDKEDDLSGLAVLSGGASVVNISGAALRRVDLDKLRTRVLVLRDEMGEAYFELGRLLHRINKEGLYVNWLGPDGKPYESFHDYVEHEVDFEFRKAKYLMSIWWWFAEELGDKEVMEKVKQVGWTKAAMLVGVVDSKNADVWIDKAKALKVRDLREQTRFAIEAAKRGRRPDRLRDAGQGDVEREPLPGPMPMAAADPTPPLQDQEDDRKGVDPLTPQETEEHVSPWTVKVTGLQRVNIERAIDVAHHIAESNPDTKGYLLDLVATSFLAQRGGAVGNNDREDKINFRNEVLRAVERTFGLDLIALERGTDRPLFGKSVIDRLAGGVDASQS